MHGGFVHLRHVSLVRLSDISHLPYSVPAIGIRRLPPSLILLRLLWIQGHPPAPLLRPPSPDSNGRDFCERRSVLPKGPLKTLLLPKKHLRHLHRLKFLLGISPS